MVAAQALGATHARILLRELLPNVLLPLLAFFLLKEPLKPARLVAALMIVCGLVLIRMS